MEREVQMEALAGLVKNLPLKLRVGINVEVLCVALQEGYMRMTDDGRLEWLLESKTLLAYFCARVWCDDYPVYNPQKKITRWNQGRKKFPEKELNALFGVEGLRNLRRQRCLASVPEGYELVENIFSLLKESIAK